MTRERPRAMRVEDGLTHAFVRESLPFRLNDTLDPGLRERIDAHLESCADCRAELALERRLAQFIGEEPGVELAPQSGLNDVLQRIDRRERRRRWWRPLAALGHPLPVAVALQALVIVALAGFLVFAPGRGTAPSYRTLTDPPAPAREGAASLRVVFADDLPLGELRALLDPLEAQIVDGPRGPGFYTLRLADDVAARRALSALRADPRVRFAEPAVVP